MNSATCGRVRDAVSLWYRTPAIGVERWLPDGLEPIVRGPWAFWRVRAWAIERWRPEGVPAWCGVSYAEVSYAVLVQAMTAGGDVRRGLRTVRRDVEEPVAPLLMERWPGHAVHAAGVTRADEGPVVRYAVSGTAHGEAEAVVRVESGEAALPAGSCFPSARDAEEAFAPPALELGVEAGAEGTRRLTRLSTGAGSVVRTPVRVLEARLSFFEAMGAGVALEWATREAGGEIRWAALPGETVMPGRLQHTHLPRRREAGKPAESSPAEAA